MPRDGMPKTRRRKYLGPEADFYDICKGKTVHIEFNGIPAQESITVKLAWVDRFTIGVRDLDTGKKTTLYKQGIHSITRCESDGLDDVPREGLPKTKRRKYLGPEATFWETCQDKMVRIVFNTTPAREPVIVRLDWVDRFSIGVHDTMTGKNSMLYKQGIHSLERDNADGASENSG